MDRRRFLIVSSTGTAALLASGSTFLLTGCNTQSVLAGLLAEMETDWQAFETAEGNTLSTEIQNAFAAAVSAVNNWKSGSPVQDVVEALQLIDDDVVPLIPTLTPTEQALAQIVLGSIINIIEFVDPSAAPTSAHVSLTPTHLMVISTAMRLAAKGHVGPATTFGTSWQAERAARKIKDDFEGRWKIAAGK